MDRVNEITKDVFNALVQLRHAEENALPAPDLMYQRMRAFIDRAMRRGVELGFTQPDVQDMGYALVALTDEVVLSKDGALREFWLPRMLQLQYFNENVAGEGFFTRLRTLQMDPSRGEVLRVYYLCLLFGFQGKYRIRGGEIELASITEDVAATLFRSGAVRELPFAPYGARPREAGSNGRQDLPLVWISLGGVVLSLCVYAGLRLLLSSSTDALVTRISTLLGG